MGTQAGGQSGPRDTPRRSSPRSKTPKRGSTPGERRHVDAKLRAFDLEGDTMRSHAWSHPPERRHMQFPLRTLSVSLFGLSLSLAPGCSCGGSTSLPAADCEYPAYLPGEVREALESGDALGVSTSDALLTATRLYLDQERVARDGDLVALFNLMPDGTPRTDGSSLTSIDWDPRHDAALLSATVGANVVAIETNDVSDPAEPVETRGLAVIGELGAARYVVLGTNPLRVRDDRGNSSVVNAQMTQFMVNALRWLRREPEAPPVQVTLAHIDEDYWFDDEAATREFLTAQFGAGTTLTEADACDGAAALGACLDAGAELLVISQDYDEASGDVDVDAVVARVRVALEAGTPVLFFRRDGEPNALGQALLDLLSVGYVADNYWYALRATAFDPSTLIDRPLSGDNAAIDTALEHLLTGEYSFTLPGIAEDPDENAGYTTEFAEGAEATQAALNTLDQRGVALFETCGNTLEKLLVLLGDRLRQDITYPMTTASTPAQTFLRAYFADHAVFNTRAVGPAQPDRGSFDNLDAASVTPVSETVELLSRPDFRSAGVYLLPGRTARITRLDDSAATVSVFVNTQRPGSTPLWEDDRWGGYDRPRFLRSESVPLVAGETVTFTNPYGGPLQLAFEESGVSVRVRFEGVGRHPHWRSPADNERFAAAVAAGVYNWVEVATPGFELHSRADYFAETMSDPRWSTPAALSAAIEQYTFNEVHVMAGFAGEGITEHPEVHGWASDQGFSVPLLDLVKHGTMDQATCGAGCSGNPYDASWAFSPIAHGDLHELGHSIQRERFQLTHDALQYPNHAATNWTPFYGASRYYDDHGAVDAWEVEHDAVFAELQAAYVAGERAGDFSTHMNTYLAGILAGGGDSGIIESYAMFLQAMAAARRADVLTDGYLVVPRIHIYERAYLAALEDDTTWAAARDGLGLGMYARADAEALTDNDFMVIAFSQVTGLDYRDFFTMWGIAISAAADAQIGAYAFPAVERAFFAMGPADHVQGALSTRNAMFTRIVIDGSTAWPLP